MKRIMRLLQTGLGLFALLGLVLGLNQLFQAQLTKTTAQPAPTENATPAVRKATRQARATPAATKKPKVDWAEATLEQVKFGKSRAVLQHHGRIRIWNWLPDNKRLLLDLEDLDSQDVATQFRIVVLNTRTGELVEYGSRSDDTEPPIWIEQTQSVAFRYWNSVQGEPPEIRIAKAGGQYQRIVASGLMGINTLPQTGDIYYLLNPQQVNPLRRIKQNQSGLVARTLFDSLSLPTGKPRIDDQGRHLAIVGRPDLPILSLTNGEIETFVVADSGNSEAPPQWVISGIWSPTGTQIGLLLGRNEFRGGLLAGVTMSLLRLDTAKIHALELPARFMMEFDWSPEDRFLIARGTPKGASMNQPERFWLIDSRTGDFKRLPRFLQTLIPEETFMAWSSNGRLAWIQEDKIMVSRFAPVR